MPEKQGSLFNLDPSPIYPPGFRYQEEVISQDDESTLIATFATLPFKEFQFGPFQGKRRVVSFGWRYDYTEQRAKPAQPIPPFLVDTYQTIQSATGFRLSNLEQSLVTEYAPGTTIGWHTDKPMVQEVLGLSHSSSCNFRLRKRTGNGNA